MNLVGKNEEQFIVFYIKLLKVDAVVGDAIQHKDEKVMRLAVRKIVPMNNIRRQVSKIWRDQIDWKLIVLRISMKE